MSVEFTDDNWRTLREYLLAIEVKGPLPVRFQPVTVDRGKLAIRGLSGLLDNAKGTDDKVQIQNVSHPLASLDRGHVIRSCVTLAKTMFEHELDEWFTVNKVPVLGPHIHVGGACFHCGRNITKVRQAEVAWEGPVGFCDAGHECKAEPR